MGSIGGNLIALQDLKLEGDLPPGHRKHLSSSRYSSPNLGGLDMMELGMHPDRGLPRGQALAERSHGCLLGQCEDARRSQDGNVTRAMGDSGVRFSDNQRYFSRVSDFDHGRDDSGLCIRYRGAEEVANWLILIAGTTFMY